MGQYKHILSLFIVFLYLKGYPQEHRNSSKDTLLSYDYEELSRRFQDNLRSNKEKAKKIGNIYLDKSRKSRDSFQIIKAYFILSRLYQFTDEIGLQYLDSSIAIASKNTKKDYSKILYAVYTRRGIFYENKGDFQNALDDYLQGLEFSKKNNKSYYVHGLKCNIGLLKRKLGKYAEAKEILRERLTYQEEFLLETKNDTLSYLTILNEVVSLYRLNKQLDSAKILNQKGIKISKGKENAYLFDLNAGILDYYDQRYLEAKAKIAKSLPYFFDSDYKRYFENYNLIDAHLHLAKSYKETGQTQEALVYFKKIDSISSTLNYVIPESRIAYLELVNYYKTKKDIPNHLLYINKLLTIDSILTKDYKSINDQLIKEFDVKELIEEKEIIIDTMSNKNIGFKRLILILTLAVFGVLGISFYQYRKKKIYFDRFEALLNNPPEAYVNSIAKPNIDLDKEPINISDEIVKDLSEKIDAFENELGFLKPGITTSSLAKDFNTNSKYLSKVVHYYRKKNFTTYINELRIDHLVERLKNDSKLRNYTIKAISEEVGFSNTQSFSNYFYRRTGIYPSYFIQKLKDVKPLI